MDKDQRKAWIRSSCPAHAERAIRLHDDITALGVTCGLGIERDGDDDRVLGVNLTIWHKNSTLGSATLDDDGLAFWVQNGGRSGDGSNADLIKAVIKGANARGEKS